VNLLATQTTDSSSSGPFSGVGDFFSSGYFTAIERISGLFVIAIWLALAFWTAKDARRRMVKVMLKGGTMALHSLR